MTTTSSPRLRRLLRDEFAVGKSIDRAIMDIDGRTLFPAGRKLTQTDVQNILKRGGYVEDIAPTTQPAEQQASQTTGKQPPKAQQAKQNPAVEKGAGEIMEALSKKHDKGGNNDERRQHQRRNWQTVIKIILEDKSTSLISQGTEMEVVTQDISIGGFGFVSNRYLYAGTRVLATFDSLPNKPTLRGVICDCHLIGGMQHRVGVRFTDIVRQEK